MSNGIREALSMQNGSNVELRGWVVTKNTVGSLLFLTIRDGSGYMQVVGKKGVTDEQFLDQMKTVSLESAIRIKGKLRDDTRAPGGKELTVKEMEIIVKADKWPISKSAVKSSAFLYDNRHLSIRGKKSSSVMKIRSEFIKAVFDFFIERNFVYINAPSIVQSAVEGGSTLFNIDYFGKNASLTQSAQLYEEAAICAFGKVFIMQPAFRAEKSKTSKHLTEFVMIEAEVAFNEQQDNIKLQEDVVNYSCARIVERRSKELEIIGRKFDVPEKPFPRISYDEVKETSEKNGINFKWGEDIPTEVERFISKTFDKPFFITDYPLSARSFYHMTKPDNQMITLSADLIAPAGFGEIATGGQRIHDYNLLVERLKQYELPTESFQWYVDLRKYGMPPHAGFGIGVERSVKWICNLKHIRATSLFPRTITRIYP
ncbi:MAG: asparagine--tRNA ligase [Nitrososphaerales archaeon]